MKIKQALESIRSYARSYAQIKRDLAQAYDSVSDLEMKLQRLRDESGWTDSEVETYLKTFNVSLTLCAPTNILPSQPPSFESRANSRNDLRRMVWDALKHTEEHFDKMLSLNAILDTNRVAITSMAGQEDPISYLHSKLTDDLGYWLQSSYGLWSIMPANRCFTAEIMVTWMLTHTKDITALDTSRALRVHVNHPNRILKQLHANGYVRVTGNNAPKDLKSDTGVHSTYAANPTLAILCEAMKDPVTPFKTAALKEAIGPVDTAWLCACKPAIEK